MPSKSCSISRARTGARSVSEGATERPPQGPLMHMPAAPGEPLAGRAPAARHDRQCGRKRLNIKHSSGCLRQAVGSRRSPRRGAHRDPGKASTDLSTDGQNLVRICQPHRGLVAQASAARELVLATRAGAAATRRPAQRALASRVRERLSYAARPRPRPAPACRSTPSLDCPVASRVDNRTTEINAGPLWQGA